MTISSIERLRKLLERNIMQTNFTLNYHRVIDAMALLGSAINSYDGEDEDWIYLGEFGTSLDSIIVGGYWHLTGWHGGQASDSYAALCSLGRAFSPGMSSGPEEDSQENDVYEMLEVMAQEA